MDDMRNSFSRLKKKIKHRLTGSKRKPDSTRADARRGRVDPTGAAGGDHDRGGSGTSADGRKARPASRVPQRESVPSGGGNNDQQGGDADIHGKEVTQRYSYLDPEAEVAVTVESRHSGEVGQVYPPPSAPSISCGGEPDGMNIVISVATSDRTFRQRRYLYRP